jgi:hypothetical protein
MEMNAPTISSADQNVMFEKSYLQLIFTHTILRRIVLLQKARDSMTFLNKNKEKLLEFMHGSKESPEDGQVPATSFKSPKDFSIPEEHTQRKIFYVKSKTINKGDV